MTRYIVRRDILEENIRAVRRTAGQAAVYGVLKANAYGLGLESMARSLAACGVNRFALTEPADAERLCALGVHVEEILLLRAVNDPQAVERLLPLPVTFSVGSETDAKLLAELGRKCGTMPRAHLQIDCGMGRYGFAADEPERVRRMYVYFSGVRFTGIYTHFSCCASRGAARRQFGSFCALLKKLEAAGCTLGVRHCGSSAVLLRYPEMRLDAVRIGSLFLGRMVGADALGLRPAGYCETTVGAVRRLGRAVTVGYGALFRTRREMTVAVLSAGTVNGFGVIAGAGRQGLSAGIRELLRAGARLLGLGGKLTATVAGKAAPVLGAVCSETAMLDVTQIPCRPGDWARIPVNPLNMGQTECVWVENQRQERRLHRPASLCAMRTVA